MENISNIYFFWNIWPCFWWLPPWTTGLGGDSLGTERQRPRGADAVPGDFAWKMLAYLVRWSTHSLGWIVIIACLYVKFTKSCIASYGIWPVSCWFDDLPPKTGALWNDRRVYCNIYMAWLWTMVHLVRWCSYLKGWCSMSMLPGWWFGTFFPYIEINPPNWLIFFRGVETTNQLLYWGYLPEKLRKIGPNILCEPPAQIPVIENM